MAQIPNSKAMTVSDGLNDYLNVNTASSPPRIEIPNNAVIQFYTDAYQTAGVKMTATGSAPVVSSTAPALANNGTIVTSGLGVSRVTPAAAVTGIIMQAGSTNGQSCIVINEGAAASTIQFDVNSTSNVADGKNCVIDGLQEKRFTWDSSLSMWLATTDTNGGALNSVMSSSAASLANNGTIATAGLGFSRVTTSGAVTGAILAAGAVPGEEIIVTNESANSITFAAVGTSLVASGTGAVIAANTAAKFAWNGTNWYKVS